MTSRAEKHLERRQEQRARHPGRRLRRWARRFVLALLVLTVALTLPLRWISPPTSSIILQRHLTAMGTQRPKPQYRWTPGREVSASLALAVVAAEDQKFPDHFGFDLESIADVLGEPGAPRRGASTISQQVAKNLYLWPGRSFLRKALEAYWTLALEAFLPKRRILEIYLNIAEFGPNIFGAGPGSRAHFKKAPSDLTDAEAALLAAVLPNPARLSASRPSDYVQKRRREILHQMNRIGGRNILKGL